LPASIMADPPGLADITDAQQRGADMNRVWTVPGCAAVFALCLSGALLAQDAGWENISHEIADGFCVAADIAQPQVLYFGTGKGLYKTDDKGLHWKNVLRDGDMTVNHIVADNSRAKCVYAATSKGIYASSDEGLTWKNIYRGTKEHASDCRALMVRGRIVYAGTEQGLLSSTDGGGLWSREPGPLGQKKISAIAADPADAGYMYAAASDGVYRRKNAGGAWERMLVVNAADNDRNTADAGTAAADTESPEQDPFLRDIIVDPERPGALYLATARGVQESDDSAVTWRALPDAGLPDRNVRIVRAGKESCPYAVTKSDICSYRAGQWHRVCPAISAHMIRDAFFSAGEVFAACDSGLFSCSINDNQAAQPGGPGGIYAPADLPDISRVQKAAITYADADMDKIREWRRQARHKALLPSVGFGVNRDTADLRHWEGGSTTKDCDDILRKGKETYEWDVSLHWDLGDLVWNDAQTSIDTRARLLVQLRADVLDEVTKLYFEFVRTRRDIDALSFMDKNKLFEKEVRLRELAAQLDGLTDGFFSRSRR
jgi:photosystem II stability/assembly factor-like uncharacterized protein